MIMPHPIEVAIAASPAGTFRGNGALAITGFTTSPTWTARRDSCLRNSREIRLEQSGLART